MLFTKLENNVGNIIMINFTPSKTLKDSSSGCLLWWLNIRKSLLYYVQCIVLYNTNNTIQEYVNFLNLSNTTYFQSVKLKSIA